MSKKRKHFFVAGVAGGIIGLGIVLSTEYNKTLGIILLIVGVAIGTIVSFIPEKN